MRQILKLIFITGFVFTFCACGGGPKGPFFWEVEKGGKTSYILGTFHEGVALEELQCSREISNHLDNSDFLWTEIRVEMNLTLLQNIQTLILEKMLPQSGGEFQNLTNESKKFFRDKITQFQSEELIASDFNIEYFSYFGLASMLQTFCTLDIDNPREKSQNQNSDSVTMDLQIQQIAQSQSISQGYLDDDMAKVLSSALEATEVHLEDVEEAVQNYSKTCSIEYYEKNVELVEDMKKRYKSGEEIGFEYAIRKTGEIFGISNEQVDKEVSQFIDIWLKQRNEKWLEKIIQSHEENNSIFVAAGTLHFTETYNVLDMLKKEGFSIKRFNASCKTK